MVTIVQHKDGGQPARRTYTVPEAASVIGVHTDTVYRLITRGKLRAIKSLRHKLIPVEELERFISEG